MLVRESICAKVRVGAAASEERLALSNRREGICLKLLQGLVAVCLCTTVIGLALPSTNAQASLSASASAEVNGQTWTASTGCGNASLDDLTLFDTVIVSADGSPDPALVDAANAGVLLPSIKYWTQDEYDCLYLGSQSNDSRQPVPTTPFDYLQLPEVQDATSGMTLDEKLLAIQGDPGAPEVTTPALDAHTIGVNFNTSQDVGYDGADVHLDSITASNASVNLSGGLFPSASPASGCTYPNPPAGSPAPHVISCSSGWMAVRILLPNNWEDAPDYGCHTTEFQSGTSKLAKQFAQHSGTWTTGDANIGVYCYAKSSSWYWDACKPAGGGTRSCTDDAGTLMSRLDYFVHNNIYYTTSDSVRHHWMIDDPWDLVTTVDVYLSNWGIAYQPGQTSTLAEYAHDNVCDGGCYIPNMDAWVTHELGHNFGASHYPDEGWRHWVCSNGFGSYYYSVMNYCWAGLHDYTTFDSGNWWTVWHRMYAR